MPATLCLAMIVKNEAHLIVDCFRKLNQYFCFDYWVINDNGSTDGTQQLIRQYFADQGVPGELDETPWQDFAFNRSKVFQMAYRKTDYALVWDADDEIFGACQMPSPLTADAYEFQFGNEFGISYKRKLLFNNHLQWYYVGVLHEYPACQQRISTVVTVPGSYWFKSGRTGARNLDPNKYLKDARILEQAFHQAYAAQDDLHLRYCFYTAQSYLDAGHDQTALDWYKKVLTLPAWKQEKYIACLRIAALYEKLHLEEQGLFYLVQSFQHDPTRVEGIYRLVKYYTIHQPTTVAYAYYTLIADYYESHSSYTNYLFANQGEYYFYLPYYMVLVSIRLNKPVLLIKMLEKIFQGQYVAVGDWWIQNLFHNFQFAVPHLPSNPEFLRSLKSFVDALQTKGCELNTDNRQRVEALLV